MVSLASRYIMRTTIGVILLAAWGRAGEPEPPMWPGRFHAMLTVNRDGDLGVTDLWYDYSGGVNINVIQTQSGEEDGPLWDNERANGSTYYYLPAKGKSKYCHVVDFDVGIIKPDWLTGATYLGEEKLGIYDCYKWEQGEIPESHLRFMGLGRPRRRGDELVRTFPEEVDIPEEGRFITYWSEKKTGRPVHWKFFDGSRFEVIRFDEGATIRPEMVQIPAYCFPEESSPVTVGILPETDASDSLRGVGGSATVDRGGALALEAKSARGQNPGGAKD